MSDFVAFLVLILLLLGTANYSREKEACEARGGVYGASACFKPEFLK
jgi:hypothetical protein